MDKAGLATATRARRRWSVALAALVMPAAAFVTAGTATQAVTTAADVDVCCAQVVLAERAASHPGSLIVAEAAESSRAMVRTMALPVGVAAERGLQVDTILAERAVSATFPEIHTMTGVRPDALRWHPEGLALDVMVPDYGSSAGKALGDRILRYVLANAQKFDLNHVIWRQAIYFPDGTAHRMPDYGGPDANHYTHVHISTNGGGYPTGNESYVLSASGPTLVKGSSTPTVTFVSAH
ncbi:hypothetical protein ACJH6J_12895 [Mycobacterium sp. SMC-18]|uniref:hypothetical protein n=1 Tax=Mycobacteriaceae TaxID=1762 RepID=UPI001BB4F215|nr:MULTISPECIES: hypothetical protein [unclassified Mycolicibacterium]MDX1878407.1 hypothetical protein [Mycolicibacterium sp. 141076]BCI82756.1 hypothetical protein MTY66_43810 [Mycolicibacterium sp. TY66]BCJ79597.1 hypothetical protein MTY81_09700 [Mycolicibacterium sp. TY81]